MSIALGWKRLSRAVAGLIAATGLAAAACATGNGAQQTEGIRVAATEQEVAGCERVINVRVLDAVSRDAARAELERLTRDRGGNVLLLPSGGDGNSGTAYRCSSQASAAAY
jgi:hypothetical protein